MGFDHGSWVFSYGNTKSDLPQTHKPRAIKITTHHWNLPPEITIDLRERHRYEREKEKETKIETCIWRWVNDDLGFVFCVLKGFEKEKIEGLIGYGFQKEKRNKETKKKETLKSVSFFFVSFSFYKEK